MKLNDNDLKEIFALLSSPTHYERNQVYDKNSSQYFAEIVLEEIYELSQEKREYALDAWRAVLFFLYKRGFRLKINDREIELSFIESEFID